MSISNLFLFFGSIVIADRIIGSTGQLCHCGSGSMGQGFGLGPGCKHCYGSYITAQGQLGINLELIIKHNYFLSSLSEEYGLLDSEGYTQIEEESGNSSQQASIYANNSFVAVCRFCTLYRDNDYVTTDQVVIYEDGHFINFCPNNSQGFFCSGCREDYYHNLGTSCVECNNVDRDWALFVISQLLPITLIFIALFLTNYSLVSGPLNAAMFFAQMISTTMDIGDNQEIPLGNITSRAHSLTAVYKFIYGPTNLEFFAPFINEVCLFKRQSYLYYFIAQYAVALYPLLLVAFVCAFYYLFKCVCTRARISESFAARIKALATEDRLAQSSRNVLASVVFLAYVKFSWLSTLLFTPISLYNYKSERAKTVIFLDPNIAFTSGDNQVFIGLALVCFCFVLLLPTLLLFVRYESVPKYFSLFRSILEPFQRPFQLQDDEGNVELPINIRQSNRALVKCCLYLKRNDKQWIPGIYLVLRILLLVVYLSFPVFTIRFVLQQIICILGAIFFLLVKPYPKQWNNNLDCLFFLILAIINTLSMYQFYLASVGRPLNPYVFAVQYIMVFTPLIWLVICIVYGIRTRYQRRRSGRLADSNDGVESIHLTATVSTKGYNSMYNT